MAKKKVSKKTTAKKTKPAVKEESNPRGRPSKYVDINLEQVEKFCKLGATDAELADFLGVTETTINNWKLEHKDFFETVTRGKQYSNKKVVKSLYNRAIGNGSTISRKQRVLSDGTIVDYTEEVTLLPDVRACEFWLKNRDPENWREKQEHKVTVETLNEALDEIDKRSEE